MAHDHLSVLIHRKKIRIFQCEKSLNNSLEDFIYFKLEHSLENLNKLPYMVKSITIKGKLFKFSNECSNLKYLNSSNKFFRDFPHWKILNFFLCLGLNGSGGFVVWDT